MSSTTNPQPTKLVSQLLLEDAGFRDVVVEFVAGLAGRLEELKAAHEKLNFEQLTMLAHRLKGAAGSYGYPDMSQLCAAMERKYRAGQAHDFAASLAHLTQMVAAAQAGLVDAP